jgi:hypothetical protein
VTKRFHGLHGPVLLRVARDDRGHALRLPVALRLVE